MTSFAKLPWALRLDDLRPESSLVDANARYLGCFVDHRDAEACLKAVNESPKIIAELEKRGGRGSETPSSTSRMCWPFVSAAASAQALKR
jgi:hypothetical protein